MKEDFSGEKGPGATIPLLSTKLTPPVLKSHSLPRPALLASLQQAAAHRLTLLCAGIGYGKTTLLAQALAHLDTAPVWYTLDRSDRDIATFLAYLIAGVDRQWPGFAAALSPLSLSGVNRRLELNRFVIHFINHLAEAATSPFLIVLDDFHLVETSAEIAHLVDYLLQHAPPTVHFVIASRAAPTLPCLSRLRANADLLEIGEKELRFDPAETAQLFRRNLRLDLPDPLIARLTARAEGWALGLLVMGQACKRQGAEAASRLAAELESGSAAANRDNVIFDYFSQEILAQHPAHIVRFLTGSAILSWLEPALCNAILGLSDAEAVLRYLEQHNLFVTRSEGGGLRYHALFRDFLIHQLMQDRERFQALHRRAAAVCAVQGNPDRAIYHHLQAGAAAEAAELIEQSARDLLQAGQVETLGYWIAQLPPALLAERPRLLLIQGQVFERYGRWSQALSAYESAAQRFTVQDDLAGLSETLSNKAHILDWWRGERVQAERLYREALAYIGQENIPRRAALLRNLSRNQLSAGNTQAALDLYQQALQIYEAEGNRQGELEALINPGSWLYHSTGNFPRALMALRRAELLAQELGNTRYLAEIYNNLAVNLYFLWRCPEAQAYAEQALALSRQIGDGHNEAYASMNLANALEATGAAPAQTLYEQQQQVLRIEQAEGDHRFAIAVLVFMTILLRRHGRPAEAVRRGKQALPLTTEHDLRWLTGFVLLNLGAAQIELDAEEAANALQGALQIASHCEDLYHALAAHFWLARLYHQGGDERFLGHLQQCLHLAMTYDLGYFFQSEAQAAIPLLALALEHGIHPDFAGQILARFGPRSVKDLQALLAHPRRGARRAAQEALAAIAQDAGGALALRSGPLPLTITCFGSLCIEREGQRLPEQVWRRRKAKRLLKYLLLSPAHAIARDEIVDRLWGDLEPQQANSNFYRTLYDVRRVLEPQAPRAHSSYLLLADGVLSLAAEGVGGIDIDQFVAAVEEARRARRRGDAAAERAALEGAVDLYRGDLFTDDPYDPWIEPQRQRLRTLYEESLSRLAALADAAQHLDQAAHYWQKLFELDDSREEVCLALVERLLRLQRRAQALRCLEACERALAELEIAVSPQLRAARQLLYPTPVSR